MAESGFTQDSANASNDISYGLILKNTSAKYAALDVSVSVEFVDTLGRIWGKGKEGSFYPFHFELGPTRLLYGFKISATSAN